MIINKSKKLPEVVSQISSQEIFSIFQKRYSEIAPVWMPLQIQWMNEVYKTFYD